MSNKSIILQSEEDSIKFARDFASTLGREDLVLFEGDLGSGKTTICRSIIKFMISEDINVASPTFNIVNIYNKQDFDIYHCDLYRLKTKEEIIELGIIEFFYNGLCLIEWPSLIEKYISRPYIKLNLYHLNSHNRKLEITYNTLF